MPAFPLAAGSERGVIRRITVTALVALLGLLGYLAATGQLALGATQSHATVSLRATKLGNVLVTANGRTLYLFMHDKKGKSTCTGQCAQFWPPLIAASKPTAGAGVKSSLLGRVRRADGRMQVTYAHHPLYRFAKDSKAGDENGEGINHFGGLWWAVSARGTAVKHVDASTTPTTTTTQTTTGYQPPPVPGY